MCGQDKSLMAEGKLKAEGKRQNAEVNALCILLHSTFLLLPFLKADYSHSTEWKAAVSFFFRTRNYSARIFDPNEVYGNFFRIGPNFL
jgi:hypothetical protein